MNLTSNECDSPGFVRSVVFNFDRFVTVVMQLRIYCYLCKTEFFNKGQVDGKYSHTLNHVIDNKRDK